MSPRKSSRPGRTVFHAAETSHEMTITEAMLLRRGIAFEAVEYALQAQQHDSLHIPSVERFVKLTSPPETTAQPVASTDEQPTVEQMFTDVRPRPVVTDETNVDGREAEVITLEPNLHTVRNDVAAAYDEAA